MRKLLIAAAASILVAGPAFAQDEPILYDGELDAGFEATLPPGEEIEAMAPALDRITGALLDLDVGPIMDAADPYRRRGWRGPRTLRDLARRDDPAFEYRLRDSIYGTAAGMGRAMDAFAAAAPALRRSVREMEREIDRALREGGGRDGWRDED